jgi:hypothetical protein
MYICLGKVCSSLEGWGCSSKVEQLPSILQEPGFDPQYCKERKKTECQEAHVASLS